MFALVLALILASLAKTRLKKMEKIPFLVLVTSGLYCVWSCLCLCLCHCKPAFADLYSGKNRICMGNYC